MLERAEHCPTEETQAKRYRLTGEVDLLKQISTDPKDNSFNLNPATNLSDV
jgi:hypothetical protein